MQTHTQLLTQDEPTYLTISPLRGIGAAWVRSLGLEALWVGTLSISHLYFHLLMGPTIFPFVGSINALEDMVWEESKKQAKWEKQDGGGGPMAWTTEVSGAAEFGEIPH